MDIFFLNIYFFRGRANIPSDNIFFTITIQKWVTEKYVYLRQSLRQPFPCAATVDQPPSAEYLMTSQQNVLTSQRMITSERCHLVSRDQTHHASERAHFVSHQEFLEYNTKQISQVYTLYIYMYIYRIFTPPLVFLFIPLFFYYFKIPYRVHARTRFWQLIMKWA